MESRELTQRYEETSSSNPFDEGISSNSFPKENEMLSMLHDLQALFYL